MEVVGVNMDWLSEQRAYGYAFTLRECFSTKFALSSFSHLCLSFCLPESVTYPFQLSTSPDILAVFLLGLFFTSLLFDTSLFHSGLLETCHLDRVL